MRTLFAAACAVGCLFLVGTAHAEAPKVLVSIAPVHSLVAAVMAGVGEPELLVPGAASDHDYALKPSDLRKIRDADLVVWIGEALENYLVKALETERVAQLELLDATGVDPRPYDRADGSSEASQDPARDADGPWLADHAGDAGADGAVEEHSHSGLDPHVWLDPVRAQALVRAIAEKLAELDPVTAERYRQNASAAIQELKVLDLWIRARLTPVAGKSFVTFHDGYSYFVERYGLAQAAQLTVNPEQRAGAASVRALREVVSAKAVVCAFAEPQFDPSVIESLAGETGMKIGVLDAIGAELEPGPSLYDALLRKNAAAVETCLSPVS